MHGKTVKWVGGTTGEERSLVIDYLRLHTSISIDPHRFRS